MILNLKNYHIDPISVALNYKTSFKKARIKIRFGEYLSARGKLIITSRKEILESLCEKDEKGNPKSENNEKGIPQYVFTPENKVKMNIEMAQLFDELFILELPDSFKDDLAEIKQMIIDTPNDLDKNEVFILEDFLKQVDKALGIEEEPSLKNQELGDEDSRVDEPSKD